MKTKKIYIYILFSLLLPFLFINNTYAIYTEDSLGTYEEELAKFPDSFKSKIEALHLIYPNARFIAQDKFVNWRTGVEEPVTWNRMMSYQYYIEGVSALNFWQKERNLIYYTYNQGYRSYDNWSYNYFTDEYTAFDNGNWYAASYKTIEYYLDPRNWLNENNVFMFESLYYHDYQTAQGVEDILSNTFMANKECIGGEGKTYAQAMIDSANANSLNAYYLAARLRQEQGVNGTSDLISGTFEGYEGYYNYFNVGASGNSNYEIVVNGLQYAKNMGWDSPYKSIVEGANFLRSKYVGANDAFGTKGQLTLYLNKWDPFGPLLGNNQYMQNITAPITEADSISSSYKKDAEYKNYAYIFYIPVYESMPDATSLPNMGSPNNYLKSLSVNGTGVTDFNGAKTSYTYTVSGAATDVYVDYTKVNSKAKVTGTGNLTLTGDKTKFDIIVTAENGDVKTYELTIEKSSTGNISVGEVLAGASVKHDDTYLFGFDIGTDANVLKNKLYTANDKAIVNIKNSNGDDKNSGALATGDTVTITSNSETKTFTVIIYGDLTGDGIVNSADLLRMRQHLIGTKPLNDVYLKAGNVIKTDNVINSADLLRMRQHLLNKAKIEQS